MSFGRSNEMTPPQYIAIGLTLLGVIVIGWFWKNTGIFGKMQIVVGNNWFFWFILAGSVIFPIWRRHRNPKEFTWAEVVAQAGITGFLMWLLCTFFYYQTSDLKNQETWNGYVLRAEYQERYETRSCTKSCDSKGQNCRETCTCTSYGPYWEISTSNREVLRISESNYRGLKQHFNNEARSGSRGDIMCRTGNTYATNYQYRFPDRVITTGHLHEYVDYLLASEPTIRKNRGAEVVQVNRLLRPYPSVEGGPYGPIEVDRIINAGINLPPEWIQVNDRALDVALATLGAEKQVNILVYVVDTTDENFQRALEHHWRYGKKNDVIVIIGMTSFPTVDWVGVILRGDDNEELKVHLRDKVMDMDNLADGTALADLIVAQVSLPHSAGGFERTPMAKMEYLAADVEISFLIQILILLIWFGLSWLVAWAMENNETQDWV